MLRFVNLLICVVGQSLPERNSLYYVYTALSKPVSAPGIFEFTAMGLLDDRKIDYYNSVDKVKIPQQDWMRRKLPADYWEKGTQSRRSKEQWFKVNVNILMERMRQNESDMHVLMWKHGCEIEKQPDGSFKFAKGVDAYGYDGRDFLSFDGDSMQWVAPVPEAVPTKQKWDGVPILNQYTKGYLEKECVDWLEKFQVYGSQDLQQKIRIRPPVVHLFAQKHQQSANSVRLTCMATEFYPKEVDLILLKKELPLKHTHHEVLPNGDGTYQARESIEARFTEIDEYSCEVNHIGLERKLERDWIRDGELSATSSFSFEYIVVCALLLLFAGAIVVLWRTGLLFPNNRNLCKAQERRWLRNF